MSPEAMRIAFILPTFTAGGAERVASLLCNYWVEQGHEVTALTFEGDGDEGFYSLDERVNRHGIDALNPNGRVASRILTNFRRVGRLRAALKAFHPEVILAFTTEANVVAIWSALGLGIPSRRLRAQSARSARTQPLHTGGETRELSIGQCLGRPDRGYCETGAGGLLSSGLCAAQSCAPCCMEGCAASLEAREADRCRRAPRAAEGVRPPYRQLRRACLCLPRLAARDLW